MRTIVQKTSAEIAIYPHNLDRISIRPKGESVIQGTGALPINPELVLVSTNKSLGRAGTWMFRVKVPRKQRDDWDEAIEDGDWVDITLQRGPRKHHVMRGIITAIDPLEEVSAEGATSILYEVSGLDHQGVFELTDIWFSSYAMENVMGGAALRAAVLDGTMFGIADTRGTVSAILFGFLAELAKVGRAIWPLPKQIGGEPFAAQCSRLFDPRVDSPARVGIKARTMQYDGAKIWDIARDWADGTFNELYCDLAKPAPLSVINGDLLDSAGQYSDPAQFYLGEQDALSPDQTQIAVILRRRPFPTNEDPEGLVGGPWSRLPRSLIRPQEMTSRPLHRSGNERLNVFEVLPSLTNEIAAKSVSLLAPLVDPEDMRLRGARVMRSSSHYVGNLSTGVSQEDLAASQRRMLCDWHCTNARLLSGTMGLKTLRPGIRVGTVAVVSENDEAAALHDDPESFTYYVESVSHTVYPQQSGSTELGVTRGFKGGENAYYDRLRKARGKFRNLEAAPALREITDASGGELV